MQQMLEQRFWGHAELYEATLMYFNLQKVPKQHQTD